VVYQPLPPAPDTKNARFSYYDPPPGIYAISATTLQGILLRNSDLYEWFRHQIPVAQPGWGINVYRVPRPEEPPTWVAQCFTPAPPLSMEAIEQGFGGAIQRVSYFDCTQAWLFPGGTYTAGWFVLHQDTPGADDAWMTARLNSARLSYQQKRPGDLPPFSIYEWRPSSIPVLGTSVRLGSDSCRGSNCAAASAPVSFGGPLDLLGYQVADLGQGDLELYTWWEVVDTPERPFSLMGHAVDASGQTVFVADGLGVPFSELQVGDQFIQRHVFSIRQVDFPAEDTIWLETGGYWLDTMERWPVVTEKGLASDRLILAKIDRSGN